MPSSSKKQSDFMRAVAHSPSFAKKVGVPQSVGKDFSAADKGRKFSKGGEMAESKAMAKKEISFMKKKGAPASMIKHEKAEYGMKKGGSVHEDVKMDKSMMQKAVNKHESRLHKGQPMTKLSKGGYTRAADGIASKGKTKGTMIAMCGGGMYKGK